MPEETKVKHWEVVRTKGIVPVPNDTGAAKEQHSTAEVVAEEEVAIPVRGLPWAQGNVVVDNPSSNGP